MTSTYAGTEPGAAAIASKEVRVSLMGVWFLVAATGDFPQSRRDQRSWTPVLSWMNRVRVSEEL